MKVNPTTAKGSAIRPFTKLKQDYSRYTDEDQSVWQLLMSRQMDKLPSMASAAYLAGIEAVGFSVDHIPNFEETNERLLKLTGWQLVAVPGIVADDVFFELLSERKFPATTWLRPMSSLDYLEEPDMFHDVFGHAPLLAEPSFAAFLHLMGTYALDYLHNPKAIHLLSRLYWFTVEFGLIHEGGSPKIYGAGILSSSSESPYSLRLSETKPDHHTFDVDEVLMTPYRKDALQTEYYIVGSYQELYHSLDGLELKAYL